MRDNNKLNVGDIIKYLMIMSIVGCILLVFVGYFLKSFNLLCVGMVILLIHNLLYACAQLKTRIWFLILQITIFTFLISRPFIEMLRGNKWWESRQLASEGIYFSINLILISLFALYVGAVIGEYVLKAEPISKDKKDGKKVFQENLQVVSMVAYYITMCFFLVQEGEKLVFMQGKTYVEFYSEFQSQLPGIVISIAALMKYSLCIYLATFPNKKRTFVALAFFEISAIPQLIIGMRNPIMLNSLFILLYYFLRDILGDKKKWIGKIERILLMIGIPFSFIFMSVYAYIRSGMKIAQTNIFRLFIDFFYGQGVTFDVLGIAYGYRYSLRAREWRNYTFGGIIDYIIHGRIGQMLWGTEALPSINCVENGTLSNNLGHNFAYMYLKEDYLKGRGYGSSYLIENYVDFGYIGVAIFSLILGILLVYMLRRFGRNTLVDTIVLVSLTTIFFIPRAEATGWLTFIITAQFWIGIAACYLDAYICTKLKWIQKVLHFLKLYPKE